MLVKAKQIMFQSSVTSSPIMSTAEKRTAEDDKEEVSFFKLYTHYNMYSKKHHMNTPTFAALKWLMIWFMVLWSYGPKALQTPSI